MPGFRREVEGPARLRLRPPQIEDESQMRAGHVELDREGFGYLFSPELAWPEQLREIERQCRGIELTAGQVQADFLVAEVGATDPTSAGEVIGRVSIRHTLTPVLLDIGGHVGYAVRPAFRGRGYATQMLCFSIERLRDLGVVDILVTCDEDNVASWRTVERCGGVLEDVRHIADGAPAKRRYWIEAD